MKRLILTLIAGTLLATALGGCIVAPAPGYYYGGGVITITVGTTTGNGLRRAFG